METIYQEAFQGDANSLAVALTESSQILYFYHQKTAMSRSSTTTFIVPIYNFLLRFCKLGSNQNF